MTRGRRNFMLRRPRRRRFNGRGRGWSAPARTVGVAFIALALLAGAPTAAGGSADYVVTFGNSMEPGFKAGDLAMVRKHDSYSVGDVVAYRSDVLDEVVLHRIVDRRGSRFVFQGDNNDFLDKEHLGDEAILGRLVTRVPRGGYVLRWLEQPQHILIILGWGMAASAAVAARRRQHRSTRL